MHLMLVVKFGRCLLFLSTAHLCHAGGRVIGYHSNDCLRIKKLTFYSRCPNIFFAESAFHHGLSSCNIAILLFSDALATDRWLLRF